MMAFFRKEWDQYFMTNQWMLFFALFIALGILNPFTAKVTPTLLTNLVGEEVASILGEPTAIDAWLQFFKNVPQMGLIAFILMMANAMSKELQQGTLPIFLAKGLKRRDVILAKVLFHSMMWTVGYVLTIIVTLVYTVYYWDQSIVQQLPMALFGLYLFGLLFIAMTFLGNTITNSTMGGLTLSGLFLVVCIVLNTFFDWQWNPLLLFSDLENRLTNNQAFSYGPPFVTMGIVIIVAWVGSILHFQRRTL